jgi:predicted RNA-binding Zn-ribbon protein involved in translation (DUF1610 family)
MGAAAGFDLCDMCRRHGPPILPCPRCGYGSHAWCADCGARRGPMFQGERFPCPECGSAEAPVFADDHDEGEGDDGGDDA